MGINLFLFCFELSLGRKNYLTLQRSPHKYHVKVSHLGSHSGEYSNLLCCITSCSLKVCTAAFFPSALNNEIFTQGAISAVLTKCSTDQGFIPVNKNLW